MQKVINSVWKVRAPMVSVFFHNVESAIMPFKICVLKHRCTGLISHISP